MLPDTDRTPESLYTLPDPLLQTILASKPNWAIALLCRIDPKLKWLDWAAQAIGYLCWLVVLAIAVNLALKAYWGIWGDSLSLVLVSILPLLLAGGTAFLLRGLRGLVKKELLMKVPQLQTDGWQHLRELTMSRLVDMLWFRVSSLLAMASDVFMKRIRSTGLRRILDDSRYEGRIVSNLIYQLKPKRPWAFEAPETDGKKLPGHSPELFAYLKTVPRPSTCLTKVAEQAAEMPTTLWFNEKDKEMPRLVACGQFTTCLNLMKFIARTGVFDPAACNFVDDVGSLWNRLLVDWTKFNSNPYFLLLEINLESHGSALTN